MGYKYSRGYDVVRSCSTAAKFYKRVSFEVVEELRKSTFDTTPYVFVDKLEEFVKDGDIASNQEEVINYILLSALNGDPNSLVYFFLFDYLF